MGRVIGYWGGERRSGFFSMGSASVSLAVSRILRDTSPTMVGRRGSRRRHFWKDDGTGKAESRNEESKNLNREWTRMDTNGKSDWLLGRRKKKRLLRSTIHDPRPTIPSPLRSFAKFAVNLSSMSRRREAASPYRVVEEAAFFLLPQ
jgi:hypothetical protein